MENLLHENITEQIIKTYYEVYNELGFGFLERVYQNAMLVGLLLNFGKKAEFRRKIFTNDRKNLNIDLSNLNFEN